MTKADELAILDSAITQLGADSYLGPWLASLSGHIERSLRNDFLPMTTEQLLTNEARLVAEATAKANDILARTETRANAIISEAQTQASRIREEMRNDLYRATRAVEGR